MPASKTTLTGGAFQDSFGNVLANGYLKMVLNQDEMVTGVGQVCAGVEIKITLDGSGNVTAGQAVWGNDNMLPVNSYYRVTGFTAAGQIAWGPNNQQVAGASPFSVSTWSPNQVISWFPPVQVPVLQTNEVTNADQALLDLHAGANISLTDNGSGRVTIAATGAVTPITLETNGVNNGSQTILNLKSGTNISLADDGVGGVTITNSFSTPVTNRFVAWEADSTTVAASQLGISIAASDVSRSVTVPTGSEGVGYLQATANPVGSLCGLHTTNKNFTSGNIANLKYRYALAQTTGERLFLGFSDITSFATFPSDDPTATNTIAFRYATGVDTTWKAYCSNGATSTVVDTLVAPDANAHTFLISISGGVCTFYYDGVLKATISTTVPANTVALRQMAYLEGRDGSGKTQTCYYMYVNFAN